MGVAQISTKCYAALVVPSITIFVRHSADCRFRDDESFKQCGCAKHLRWSHEGKQYRRSAKTRSWSEAEKARRKLEEQFEAGGAPAVVHVDESRPTIEDAVRLFLVHVSQGTQVEEVYKTYVRETGRLKAFCESRGRYFAAELTTPLILEYRATWPEIYGSDMSRRFVQSRLKRFLRFCFGEGWIERMPQLSMIEATPEEANPLEPEQFTAALAAAEDDKVKGVMLLMRHGGLAVVDATLFERANLSKKEKHYLIEYYRRKVKKRRRLVTVPIPIDIAEEILSLAYPGRYLFWDEKSKWRSAVQMMTMDIRDVFRKAFGKDTEFTSHNLRDTAGAEWLIAGISLEVVSEMLGHSSVLTTEKHYKKLIDRLRAKHVELVVRTFGGAQ